MDELEAIRRCQEGERGPFRLLVDRYEEVLYGTAYLMTRDHGLAEEMVQETFLRAWRAIPSLRGHSFKAWVVRILVNHVMSERRKKRVQETALVEATVSSEEGSQVEEAVLHREERDRIRDCLDKLSQEQREAILLRYYSGLRVPEIARALGWRQGTVKSRLHRALGALRQALLNDEEQPNLESGW